MSKSRSPFRRGASTNMVKKINNNFIFINEVYLNDPASAHKVQNANNK